MSLNFVFIFSNMHSIFFLFFLCVWLLAGGALGWPKAFPATEGARSATKRGWPSTGAPVTNWLPIGTGGNRQVLYLRQHNEALLHRTTKSWNSPLVGCNQILGQQEITITWHTGHKWVAATGALTEALSSLNHHITHDRVWDVTLNKSTLSGGRELLGHSLHNLNPNLGGLGDGIGEEKACKFSTVSLC